MNIPKIIHQTWKDEDLPEHFKILSDTWKDLHPDWEYILWTDEMNRNLIKENYPDFLSIYDNYSKPIQKVDAARCFILLKYGGLYVDLDFECFRNIESLLSEHKCVIGKEPKEHCDIHDKNLILSNAFMASEPDNSFINAIVNEFYKPINVTNHANNMVLESTGPFMLTRVYNSFRNKCDVSITNSEYLYPLSKNELEEYFEGGMSLVLDKKLKKSYAIHYYIGTWWKEETLKRQMGLM